MLEVSSREALVSSIEAAWFEAASASSALLLDNSLVVSAVTLAPLRSRSATTEMGSEMERPNFHDNPASARMPSNPTVASLIVMARAAIVDS